MSNPNPDTPVSKEASIKIAERIRAKYASASHEIGRLKEENHNLSRKALSSERKLTLSAPVLAVTEPVSDSFGKTRQVQLVELLDKDLYSRLRPLVGPLMEVAIRTIQGSNLTQEITLKELDDKGRPTSKDLMDKENNLPIKNPSTVDQVKHYYRQLAKDPKFQEGLSLMAQAIKGYEPSITQTDTYKGVVHKYAGSEDVQRLLAEMQTFAAKGSSETKQKDFGPEFG